MVRLARIIFKGNNECFFERKEFDEFLKKIEDIEKIPLIENVEPLSEEEKTKYNVERTFIVNQFASGEKEYRVDDWAESEDKKDLFQVGVQLYLEEDGKLIPVEQRRIKF